MSEPKNQFEQSAAVPVAKLDSERSRAALTEANRHADILYASLAGVTGIVFVLLVEVALPMYGRQPITSLPIFAVLVMTSLAGLGAICGINIFVHRQATTQALLTEVLLNSLGQGFLTFDQKGICGEVYSQACIDLLESSPGGRPVVDVLRLNDEQKNDFKDWAEMLFAPNHALSFDDVVKFLPQSYAHTGGGRHIGLVYKPVYDHDKRLLSIVLIATDQTDEAESQLRARVQQNYVNMICRIFKERNHFMVTITHLRKFVDEANVPVSRQDSSSILRLLHTLKAAAKHFYLESLSDVIRKLEVELRSTNLQSDREFCARLRKGADEVQACINSVLEQVGDLIGQDFEGQRKVHEVDEESIYTFARVMRENKIQPALIQQYLSAIAAVPINESFHQFERELKDLAEIMGKKVKPVLYTGSNPRILARPLEGFFLSVMHICRNIIDHGIEPVVTRLARGKEPAGQVTIFTDMIDNSSTGSQMLLITIADDGNGIDPALVRAKLAKIDPDGEWVKDDDQAVIQRILLWEVSTKNVVTDLSGRGVGMEAVDREVKLLGGTIKVYSELYKSTRFEIAIPYSLNKLVGQRI